MSRPFAAPLLLALAAAVAGANADGAGPPVVVEADPGADPATVKHVREVVGSRRAIRDDVPLPGAASVSTERAATEQRVASIRLALDRARKAESEASWEGCVREAASALSDAIEVLAKVDDLALVRELHAQMGACMTLDDNSEGRR